MEISTAINCSQDPGPRRARAAIAALEQNGIAPGEIGVEALPPGF